MSAIDPKAVKAGDTVTLESVLDEPFEVTGVVEKINVTQTDSSGKAVAFNVMIWARWFTVGLNLRLADHQPTPEPEVDTLEKVIWEAADTDGIEPLSKIAADKMADAIRARFVVIDPAKVDVDALRTDAFNQYDERGGSRRDREFAAILSTLAGLGITGIEPGDLLNDGEVSA